MWTRNSSGRLSKLEIPLGETGETAIAPAVDTNNPNTDQFDTPLSEFEDFEKLPPHLFSEPSESSSDSDQGLQQFPPNHIERHNSVPTNSSENFFADLFVTRSVLSIDPQTDQIVDTSIPAAPATSGNTPEPSTPLLVPGPVAAPPPVLPVYRARIKGGTDHTMANPTPLPTYYGDTRVKQYEFIDSLRQYHRTQQRAQRMGHVDWDTVLTAGQFLKGEAHREWQQFIRDHNGLPIIETNRDLWR